MDGRRSARLTGRWQLPTHRLCDCEEQVFATLGTDLVWLLLAAVLIIAALKYSGLIERFTALLMAHPPGRHIVRRPDCRPCISGPTENG